ncbi:MAG: hypothetical protein PWP24_1983 [Clostridiales bacterium]|nr:hypothetical protein [Clostridiales bacterium]
MLTDVNQKNQACIDACTKCSQACYECFHACLNEPDVKERIQCICMLVECAMMCQMSVSMMSMHGKFEMAHCAICADVCDACAKECGGFSDQHCQECAAICKNCSKECQNMARM